MTTKKQNIEKLVFFGLLYIKNDVKISPIFLYVFFRMCVGINVDYTKRV